MCVGRFRLGFTHDASYILHVTCSCIFHAYVSFHFSISGCDVFLSLSLSLSLSDRLYMAPKRKSTSAQNHLGSESSSFDPPVPPLHVRFRDRKAQQDFLENF